MSGKDDWETLKPTLRLGLSDQEWAEFKAFLDSLPSPSERLSTLIKKDEAWPK